MIYVADAAAIKVCSLDVYLMEYLWTFSQEITTYRHRFPKPLFRYEVLNAFGSNIISSEGEEWKKYRKITAPAFSEVCPKTESSPGPEQALEK